MLTSLSLRDFRNYKNQKFVFTSQKVLFCGENGKGKTNVLEAISLLSTGKSWRETTPKDLIFNPKNLNPENKISESAESAIISGSLQNGDLLEVVVAPRSRVFRKNEKPVPRNKFFGQMPTLLFCPEFINLFSSDKKNRTAFFDRFLAQIYPKYRETLIRTTKAHQQKTKLLRNIEFLENTSFSQIYEYLRPWNQILAEEIPEIIKTRQTFLSEIAPVLQNSLQTISQKNDSIKISLKISENIEPQTTAILEFFEKNIKRELGTKKNFIAPHRDDFEFFLRGFSLSSTSSRGEERSVLIALLDAQKIFLAQKIAETPILLLDDVFSELDDHRQKHLENVCQNCQTFFTTTHKEHFRDFKDDVQVFSL